ncbi:Por secretion system C-terminal sorting domain-containing protein [Bifidobacterium ramosum]|uniref:Por secretion system C-terminal sorting domain-containing protein n=1 Tax=Bifidobacterium ramosum TaxID=1798158 RepID=A0A6L4X3M8_9BIFI|nr:hypothetical protein [Bifidobacterium ramosum]KAB8288625.1 Por secretion system C-terminal sorting domain-containing protein [Bifidobacterium ramosum]NEG71511.1 hypothetical protein [Bifidobacterium ramosum]
MRSVKKVLGTALALTASIAMLAGGAPVVLAADVAGDIPIDASHFPDKALRACVINPNSGVPIDTDEDGMLSVAERNAVTSFSCYGGVDSTQGLELFPNLTDLSIEDVSSVDVSKNPKLTSLSLLSGSFASLDVSHNLQLKELNLDGGKLTSVDVSHNPELTKLSVYSNPLSSLDVSHNPKLTELNVQESALASVDVSKNPLLEILHLRDNKLTSLDVTHNPKLIELFASNNALSSLDVSKNPALV